MSKIKSKKTGQRILSNLQTFVTVIAVLIWVCMSGALYLIWPNLYVVAIFFAFTGCVLAILAYVTIFDKERFDNIVDYLKFVRRAGRGEDEIKLFQLPIDEMKKHIPIEKIHDHGLIEYISHDSKIVRVLKIAVGGQRPFGVIFKYDPPQVPESEEEDFNDAIKRIVDSIGPDLRPSLHYYCMIDGANPLADDLLDQLNDPDISVQQMKHLHGMYKTATENTDPRIADEYLFSIKLGDFRTVDHAMQVFRSTMPGILQSFQERGIYTTQVIGEGHIAMEFSNFAIMERR